MKKTPHFLITALFLFTTCFLNAAHKGPDRYTHLSMEAFTNEFVKVHGLKFLAQCSGKLNTRSLWCVSLTSSKTMTLDEGRNLAKELAFGMLYRMYHDPVFADYCKERSAEYSDLPNWVGTDRASPALIDEYIAFKLAFWDNDVNRPSFPYLAQIRLENNILYFHYADPKTGALQEPIVETLDSLNLPNYK